MEKTLGDKIRDTRKRHSLTQAELAERSGISTMSLRRYEADERQPKIYQLQRIATALNVTVNYLLGNLEYHDFERTGKVATDEDGVIIAQGENVSLEDIKFALWGHDGKEMDDKALDDVRRFAEFILQREKDEKASKGNPND